MTVKTQKRCHKNCRSVHQSRFNETSWRLSGRDYPWLRNIKWSSGLFLLKCINFILAIPTVRPDILLVECEVASAKIFWAESSDHSSMNSSLPLETFLQISTGNDTFVNCSYEKIETNKSKYHFYKVDKLKPYTKYRFKLMVSDTLRSDFSNIWTCTTDKDKKSSKYMFFISFSYCRKHFDIVPLNCCQFDTVALHISIYLYMYLKFVKIYVHYLKFVKIYV